MRCAYRLDGGIVGFGVHIDHHLVLLAQIVDHAVHVHLRQAGKGVQGHTDAEGGDAGNGHGPVLAQVAHAAPGQETERRDLHACTSISSSFGSTGGWGIIGARGRIRDDVGRTVTRAVEAADQLVLMGDDQHSDAHFADTLQQLHHLKAQLWVDVAGGLVRDDQLGAWARARATATRCCSPPESRSG